MSPSNPIGQKQLLQHLEGLAKNNRIANTYMLVGSEGVGKLSIALAFIKIVLSSSLGKDSEAVRAAELKVDSLSHPDLHFSFPVNTNDKIKKDPVSKDFLSLWREMLFDSPYFSLHDWYKKIRIGNKQGVISAKEAEKISKTMSLKSYEGGYKFMVIWMAEKMNPSASNKLLKLLEEPPKSTVFLLLSENPAGILETIRSRCQKIEIPPIASNDIAFGLGVRYKTKSSTAEKIGIKSKGNYRAACQLAENQEVAEESSADFIRWVRLAFRVKTSKEALGEIISFSENMAKKSREDQKAFLKSSLSVFRKGLLYNYAVERNSAGFDNGFKLEKFAPFVHENNVVEIYDEVQSAHDNIERNGNSKIVFLDASIKLTRLLHKKPSDAKQG
ncbi:MAG: DNA polymerase III subunit delta' [Acidimicrobiaceae bacterium]|nr:DNA polymerase III subunit delta' [Acidimicrobiaceae bacterium]